MHYENCAHIYNNKMCALLQKYVYTVFLTHLQSLIKISTIQYQNALYTPVREVCDNHNGRPYSTFQMQ